MFLLQGGGWLQHTPPTPRLPPQPPPLPIRRAVTSCLNLEQRGQRVTRLRVLGPHCRRAFSRLQFSFSFTKQNAETHTYTHRGIKNNTAGSLCSHITADGQVTASRGVPFSFRSMTAGPSFPASNVPPETEKHSCSSPTALPFFLLDVHVLPLFLFSFFPPLERCQL